MKKYILITSAIACIFIFTSLMFKRVSAQTTTTISVVSDPIPVEVMQILSRSCTACHAEPGKGMALSSVNLTQWDKYSKEKQASKATAICNEATDGKMPPKSYKKDHPDAALSENEIKTVCDWAESLKHSEN
jgi:hypothetical protein